MTTTETKKTKRKLNSRFIALVAVIILICLSIYKVPHFINVNRLLDLGYSDEAITAIYQKGLRSSILKNNYYSDYLNQEVTKENFNKKYLKLYTLTDYLDEDYFDLYEFLKANKVYSDEELEQLYSSLKIYNLKPLIVFDKLEDIEVYVKDCNNHENTENKFYVSNDYLHPYENYKTIEDPTPIDVYVSGKSYIGEYAPEKLVDINARYSVPNVKLESRAHLAFEDMSKAAASELTKSFYAINGYVSYEDQKILYMQDASNIKEGFADAQTGLGVYLKTDDGVSFKETSAYQWLMNHAHEFGFIQRFPEGKEALTGHKAVYNYFRYVGKELATKIHDSGLSFDEYYFNYINDYS